MRLFAWILASLLLVTTAQAQAPSRTQVMVISSMHGLHASRASYSYDDLYRTVRAFSPDLVGVEIRPEDMQSDDAYLSSIYPREMVELRREYGDRAFGFDWYGEAFEGRLLPEGWAEQAEFVQLQRAKQQDPRYAEDPELERLLGEKTALLGADVTAGSLNDGRYDAVNAAYYQRLGEWLRDTPYAGIPEFSLARDDRIGRNIIAMIRANPGKRIAVVMGADHRSFAVAAIRTELADEVEIVPTP